MEAGKAATEATAARERFEQQQADFQKWLAHVVHLEAGDAVRVREFDRDGKVVRMRLEQQRAEVDVGAFTVEVPLGDLLPPQTPAPPPRPPRPVVPRSLQAQGPPGGRRDGAGRHGGPGPGRAGGPRAGGREGAAHVGGGGGAGRGREVRPRPVPQLPALSVEQAAALQPMDAVYVKRFHREGRVVRVKAAKQLVVVNVGLLDVEVPFDGLAQLPKREAPKPPEKKKPKAAEAAPGGAGETGVPETGAPTGGAGEAEQAGAESGAEGQESQGNQE
jgi:hypothetical protein